MQKIKYSVPLEITFKSAAGKSTPVRVALDFDKLIGREHRGRLIDPHTLTVVRKTGKNIARYPVQFDEHLYTQNQGWIAWRVQDPMAGSQWHLEFALRNPDGQLAPVPYRPMVGVGDEIFYNGNRWHPIGIPGMHQFPIPIDWDGDGKIDIVSTTHYSAAQGMPWAGIVFWKNIGTNAKPRFAPPVRLSADGVGMQDGSKFWHWPGYESEWKFRTRRDFIGEYYIRCDFFDWFGAGRQDLITCSAHGHIRVYRNTGAKDAAGRPRLELAVKIPLPKTMPLAMHIPIRVVDWDGSGRPSILLGVGNYDFGVDHGQFLLLLNSGGTRQKPTFTEIPISRSDHRVDPNLKDWSKVQTFIGGRTGFFDLFDIDGDGQNELLICHGYHMPYPVIEVWKNVGTPHRPVMNLMGNLPWSVQPTTFSMRFVKNTAFDGCLIASINSGAGIHYFKRQGNPFDPKGYRDTGPLLGEGAKIKVEGYVRPSPIDLYNTGKMDLVCGDEPGFLTRIKNVGTREKPAFSDWERIRDAKNQVIHLRRETILHDFDLERDCGQLKPQVVDWDADGKPDIIVANNTNRILWLKDYDPKKNRVREIRELKVRGSADPFGWRKGQAIADFDGDGDLELVTADNQGQIAMFKKTRDPGILKPGIPLRYTNGKIITNNDVPPNMYKNQLVWMYPCDWTGTGTIDLLIGSNTMVSLLENVGTKCHPKFKKYVSFKTPDGDLRIGHHETQPATWDWDNDGRTDLMVGGENGAIYLFHRDWLAGIVHNVRVGKAELIT